MAAGKRAERKVNEVLGDWRASVAQMTSTQVGHATAAAPLVKRSKGTPQCARLQLYSGHIRGKVSIAFRICSSADQGGGSCAIEELQASNRTPLMHLQVITASVETG